MRNKILFITSIFLFLVGSFLVFRNIYINDGSFTVVNYGQSKKQLSGFKEGPLLRGEIVSGRFKASSNNLGGVGFRFDNQNKISTDSVIFRLIDQRTGSQIYQGTYKVDQFQPKCLFPFGFPIINDSKNKMYLFEIESASGSAENSIALSKISPIFSIKYQFSKSTITTFPSFIHFLLIKTASLLVDKEFLIIFLVYMSPWIIVNIYMSQVRKNKKQFTYSLLPVLIIVISLFTRSDYPLLTTQALILDWLMAVFVYKMESRVSSLIAVFFFVASALFTVINKTEIVEKTVMWTYIFLIISITQAVFELISKPFKLNTFDKCVSKICSELYIMKK